MAKIWQEFKSSSIQIKLALLALGAIWSVVIIMLLAGAMLLLQTSSQAQLPDLPGDAPVIVLDPNAGLVNSPITVRGQGWVPDNTVLIYLATPSESTLPDYAVAVATVDWQGQFTASIIILDDPRWQYEKSVKVIARTPEGQAAAQAFYNFINMPAESVETPAPTTEPVLLEPTSTSTAVPAEPAATSQPNIPVAQVTALTAVNVRSGPGTDYSVLGVISNGQTAEITGVSPDHFWWQIRFTGARDERGWVSAKYVTAENTGNVPVVESFALPPTPRLMSVVITDWQGEYYNNLNLSGSPALVRNDVSINFDWSNGSPATGINADNFSVRWTRSMNFPAGIYRFYARVDDGLRLWVDNTLVIDRWHENSPTTYSVDVMLADGLHNIKMEYFERAGTAVAQLAWEWLETYPDWKGEYFDNPSLSGRPVLVRNDSALQFSWGSASPGPGVPADNFSVRWTRDLYFSAGTYRFKVLVDDGVRLWIDGNLLIDRWRAGEPQTFTGELTLSEGMHNLKLEYFEFRYDAQVRLDWERLSSNYPDWKAEYYANRKLEGSPTLVRNEAHIDYNWGGGAPAAGIPADNFSARWSRKANFQTGVYTFRVKVDDGVRMWLDDVLIIDSWQDGGTRALEAERQLSEGQHRLKVEYYERGGEARIEVSWQKKEIPANQSPRAIPGGPYNVDEGSRITLDGRASNDPDGSIVNYEWDFDYKDGVFTVDAVGATASPQQYADGPATIIIALRVTDNQGLSHIAATSIMIRNLAPVVEAGGPYLGQTGSAIMLAGTAIDAGLIDQTGLSYRWDFGDGSQGSGPVVSHSYTQAGTYTVSLTVRDKDGAEGVDTATVQVLVVPAPDPSTPEPSTPEPPTPELPTPDPSTAEPVISNTIIPSLPVQ